jgi:hypothetical protein
MKKGMIPKLSRGVALAAAVALCGAPRASADLSAGSDSVTFLQGAHALVMPFDLTGGRVSFEVVSYINSNDGFDTNPTIPTHWSYWAADCRHLQDVNICLTANDTVVVDPTKLHGEVQDGGENKKLGPDIDLTGERGIVVVSAFELLLDSNGNPVGNGCQIDNPPVTVSTGPPIVGSWTIANTGTNTAFGADAIGLDVGDGNATNGFDQDALDGGIFLQTFNPQQLTDSAVILISVQQQAGNGRQFELAEWGPLVDGVCCDVDFTDNVEVFNSQAEFCFECVGFAAIGPDGGVSHPDDPTILRRELNLPGVVRFSQCTEQADGLPLDATLQYLFAYHGEAVGPFGVVTTGRYTGDAF